MEENKDKKNIPDSQRYAEMLKELAPKVNVLYQLTSYSEYESFKEHFEDQFKYYRFYENPLSVNSQREQIEIYSSICDSSLERVKKVLNGEDNCFDYAVSEYCSVKEKIKGFVFLEERLKKIEICEEEVGNFDSFFEEEFHSKPYKNTDDIKRDYMFKGLNLIYERYSAGEITAERYRETRNSLRYLFLSSMKIDNLLEKEKEEIEKMADEENEKVQQKAQQLIESINQAETNDSEETKSVSAFIKSNSKEVEGIGKTNHKQIASDDEGEKVQVTLVINDENKDRSVTNSEKLRYICSSSENDGQHIDSSNLNISDTADDEIKVDYSVSQEESSNKDQEVNSSSQDEMSGENQDNSEKDEIIKKIFQDKNFSFFNLNEKLNQHQEDDGKSE